MDRLRPEEMYPAGISDVSVRYVRVQDDVRLRVLESGPHDGVPVLLLHGWAASAFMHRFALAALARAGFRAIAVDIKGHGVSEKPVGEAGLYTAARLVDDIDNLIDALGLGRVALVGQSMGGGIAMRVAIKRPAHITALVLVNPTGISPIPVARIARVVSPPLVDRIAPMLTPRWLAARLLRLTYGDSSRVTEQEIDEYWAPSQFPEFARAMRALVWEFDWSPLRDEQLRILRMPTQLVLGTADRLIRGALEASGRLPRAAKVVIEGGGHDVNEERHEQVNVEMVRFLSAAISA